MYKIFFDDRYLSLGEVPPPEGSGILCCSFEGREALGELLRTFAEKNAPDRLHLVHDDLEELRQAIRSHFHCLGAGGGVVYRDKASYLAIRRKGMWDLPKGKLDPGETFEEAALREVKEECGLENLELKHLLTSTFHTYVLKGRWVLKETRWFEMFYGGRAAPVLQEEEGITGYRWVKAGEDGPILEGTYASIRDVLGLKCLRGRA